MHSPPLSWKGIGSQCRQSSQFSTLLIRHASGLFMVSSSLLLPHLVSTSFLCIKRFTPIKCSPHTTSTCFSSLLASEFSPHLAHTDSNVSAPLPRVRALASRAVLIFEQLPNLGQVPNLISSLHIPRAHSANAGVDAAIQAPQLLIPRITQNWQDYVSTCNAGTYVLIHISWRTIDPA